MILYLSYAVEEDSVFLLAGKGVALSTLYVFLGMTWDLALTVGCLNILGYGINFLGRKCTLDLRSFLGRFFFFIALLSIGVKFALFFVSFGFWPGVLAYAWGIFLEAGMSLWYSLFAQTSVEFLLRVKKNIVGELQKAPSKVRSKTRTLLLVWQAIYSLWQDFWTTFYRLVFGLMQAPLMLMWGAASFASTMVKGVCLALQVLRDKIFADDHGVLSALFMLPSSLLSMFVLPVIHGVGSIASALWGIWEWVVHPLHVLLYNVGFFEDTLKSVYGYQASTYYRAYALAQTALAWEGLSLNQRALFEGGKEGALFYAVDLLKSALLFIIYRTLSSLYFAFYGRISREKDFYPLLSASQLTASSFIQDADKVAQIKDAMQKEEAREYALQSPDILDANHRHEAGEYGDTSGTLMTEEQLYFHRLLTSPHKHDKQEEADGLMERFINCLDGPSIERQDRACQEALPALLKVWT